MVTFYGTDFYAFSGGQGWVMGHGKMGPLSQSLYSLLASHSGPGLTSTESLLFQTPSSFTFFIPLTFASHLSTI